MTNNSLRHIDQQQHDRGGIEVVATSSSSTPSATESIATMNVPKMYLYSLQRIPPVISSVTGLFHYNNTLMDEASDRQNEQQVQQPTPPAMLTIYNVFQNCERYKPKISAAISNKTKQQQQSQTNNDNTILASSMNGSNNIQISSLSDEQQQQIQQQKIVMERLVQQEKMFIYYDCLAHTTCPMASTKYRNCWKQMIYLINEQYLNNNDDTRSPITTTDNVRNLEQTIQYWNHIKNEGYLNSICITERETVERCIGTTIQNANYERQFQS